MPYIRSTEYGHANCIEKVVIYFGGYKKAPLQLLFREEDNVKIKTNTEQEKWCVGYPNDGVIWLYKYKPPLPNNRPYPIDEQQTIDINLNRPAVIAELINYFLQTTSHQQTAQRTMK